jgi:UDP-glucose:glycoprotein glucosyltransferase
LPFDHVYNPSATAPTVVLYADIETEAFKSFHTTLKTLAKEDSIRYILRYRPSQTRQSKDKSLFVAGYGVELMLKRTDYIVIDDREVETGSSPHTDLNLPQTPHLNPPMPKQKTPPTKYPS